MNAPCNPLLSSWAVVLSLSRSLRFRFDRFSGIRECPTATTEAKLVDRMLDVGAGDLSLQSIVLHHSDRGISAPFLLVGILPSARDPRIMKNLHVALA
jgi:hypothetical protein